MKWNKAKALDEGFKNTGRKKRVSKGKYLYDIYEKINDDGTKEKIYVSNKYENIKLIETKGRKKVDRDKDEVVKELKKSFEAIGLDSATAEARAAELYNIKSETDASFINELTILSYAVKEESKTDKQKKIKRAILNTGEDPEDLAARLGITEEELFKESNWTNNIFTIGNNKYRFEFKYNGETMVKL